jgi:hypothetical protein
LTTKISIRRPTLISIKTKKKAFCEILFGNTLFFSSTRVLDYKYLFRNNVFASGMKNSKESLFTYLERAISLFDPSITKSPFYLVHFAKELFTLPPPRGFVAPKHLQTDQTYSVICFNFSWCSIIDA